MGKILGSAATIPSDALVPKAVLVPVQYALTVNDAGFVATEARCDGCLGRGFRAKPAATRRAAIATLVAINRC